MIGRVRRAFGVLVPEQRRVVLAAVLVLASMLLPWYSKTTNAITKTGAVQHARVQDGDPRPLLRRGVDLPRERRRPGAHVRPGRAQGVPPAIRRRDRRVGRRRLGRLPRLLPVHRPARGRDVEEPGLQLRPVVGHLLRAHRRGVPGLRRHAPAARARGRAAAARRGAAAGRGRATGRPSSTGAPSARRSAPSASAGGAPPRPTPTRRPPPRRASARRPATARRPRPRRSRPRRRRRRAAPRARRSTAARS